MTIAFLHASEMQNYSCFHQDVIVPLKVQPKATEKKPLKKTSQLKYIYSKSLNVNFFLSYSQVFDDCHEGGEISPSNCVYMNDWLDF